MSNVVFWRQVFLGASLFLCGGYPIIAAEVGDLTPNVGTRSLQQDFSCVLHWLCQSRNSFKK